MGEGGLGVGFKPPGGGAPAGASLYYDAYAARPAAGTKGSRFVASDGAVEFVDDGAAWRPLLGGRRGTELPTVATWTTAFGTIAGTDLAGTVQFISTGAGAAQLAGLTDPLAAATNYEVTACVRVSPKYVGDVGIILRDSVTGDAYFLGVHGDGYSMRWMRASYSGGGGQNLINAGALPVGPEVWFRVSSDFVAGDSFQLSADGLTWHELVFEAARAIVPDELGIGLADDTAATGVFCSWERT